MTGIPGMDPTQNGTAPCQERDVARGRIGMEIVLGLDADRQAWPPTTNGAMAQAGGLVTGPAGLLHVVETALGLGGPPVPAVRRLALWRAKLAAADAEGRFWHRSFATDAFATARLLLDWRDRLVESGWHPGAIAAPPPRLADLAAAEAAGPALPPGAADRTRRAIAALTEDPPPEPIVARIRLLDRRAVLPPGLRAMLDALAASGTDVTEEPEPETAAQGDLGAAQGVLRGLGAPGLLGDGRFTLLEAETETAAAELVADRLKADADLGGAVLLATRPTAILDAALRRRHLPRLGIGAMSPLRGILQALPLGLATRWAPFDARRMLEFLQLPRCPLPREIRRTLTNTLPQTPGRGGKAWKDAIAEGMRAFEERLAAEIPDPAKRKPRRDAALEAVAVWLEGELTDPDAGMPASALLRLCTALANWAHGMAAGGEELAEVLASHANALAEAVQETGLGHLPRIAVERMLDAVMGEGTRDPAPCAEAAPWGTASAPGAVWGRPRLLVWWGFDSASVPAPDPWQAEEVAALDAAGCRPWQAIDMLRAASASWRRPILAARDRALLVAIRGADAEAHPLAHELVALLEPYPALRPRAEALNGAQAPELAGVTLDRAAAAEATLPQPRETVTMGAAISGRRDKDSATSLERLLACPFAWVMDYRARLREGRFAEIAEDEKLIGLLAHRLAEELLTPGAAPDPGAIAAEARQRLPALIEEAAAPLLQTGSAAERARVEEMLPKAIAYVAQLLRDSGLEVVEAEAQRSDDNLLGQGEALGGGIDLLLRDAQGRPALLDLKWSRSVRSYRDRVREGHAVQLAAYSALVGAEDRAAYVLLGIPTAIAVPGGLPILSEDTAPSLAATWEETRNSRGKRQAALAEGRIHALGLRDEKDKRPDPDGAPLAAKPPCRFCAHGVLCGKETVA